MPFPILMTKRCRCPDPFDNRFLMLKPSGEIAVHGCTHCYYTLLLIVPGRLCSCYENTRPASMIPYPSTGTPAYYIAEGYVPPTDAPSTGIITYPAGVDEHGDTIYENVVAIGVYDTYADCLDVISRYGAVMREFVAALLAIAGRWNWYWDRPRQNLSFIEVDGDAATDEPGPIEFDHSGFSVYEERTGRAITVAVRVGNTGGATADLEKCTFTAHVRDCQGNEKRDVEIEWFDWGDPGWEYIDLEPCESLWVDGVADNTLDALVEWHLDIDWFPEGSETTEEREARYNAAAEALLEIPGESCALDDETAAVRLSAEMEE